MLTCVLIPDFAVAIERQQNPALSSGPLLIASTDRHQRVVASSSDLRALGVKRGDSLRQALLICPEAEVIPANGETYQRIAEDTALSLHVYANNVELEYQLSHTAFYLATDDPVIATAFPAQIAVAANKFTARVAAAYAGRQPRYVEPGDEAAFLSDYPVTLLPLSREMARRLPLLGIHTLGQYGGLPRMAAWEQFGRHGRWLHELANGIDPRPIQAFRVPERLCNRRDFDDPTNDRELVRTILRHMARSSFNQMSGRQAGRLALMLHLESGQIIEVHAQPARPIHDFAHLVRRLDNLLDQQLISSPVNAVTLRLMDLRVHQPRQLTLFDHADARHDLEAVVPDWIARHRGSRFYSSECITSGPSSLPEDRFELHAIWGA